MSTTFLSKSSFLKGVQCPKQLWLYKNQPELMDPVGKHLEAIFRSGHRVGELATQLFPGGKMLPCDTLSFGAQVETTQAWIEKGVETIYEAAFSQGGVFARVDILHKGADGWEIYEVKSSTRVKDVYIQDVAVQTWILKQAGVKVSKCALVTLDGSYRLNGEIEVDKLFAVHDLTQAVEVLQSFVQNEIVSQQTMLEQGPMPEILVGKQCSDPYRCAFFNYCHGEVADDSVFRLADIGRPNPYDLYHDGKTRFADIDSVTLGWRQHLQVTSYLQRVNRVKKEHVQAFLETLWYPICHFDFETTHMVAVPMFDGTGPYQQVPFQFSMHIQSEPNATVEHVEFLANPGEDPRRPLLEALLAALPEKACVLAYNKGFEERCLKNLAHEFPEYKSCIESIIPNLRDLMIPFRSKDVYFWEMNGSYSLKQVLPALLPEMGYADLEIGDGEAAANAYLEMWDSRDPDELAETRKNLLKYCELDTFAMVKLLEKLQDLVAE